METKTEAAIEDLYNAPNDWGTHELVNGKLVRMPPTGFEPNRASRPDDPTLFQPEDVADAEPTLPGWQIAVSDIFR